MACKSSNSVEQDKEGGGGDEKEAYRKRDDKRKGNEKEKADRSADEQIEQIYHIATEPLPPVPKARKDTNRKDANRKDAKPLKKSKSEDSDDFKVQINSFYDNLYRMKNDLTKQTKPKSRWVKIIKEREF